MNGFEAVREVRRLERLSGSPPQTIIGISAQYDGYTVPFALAEGFDLFLAKPFTMNSISRHLKSIKGDSEGGGMLTPMVLNSQEATPNTGISGGDNTVNDANDVNDDVNNDVISESTPGSL